MCGIIASKSIKKFKELVLLNQSRGTFSHSLTMLQYDDTNKHILDKSIYRQFGEFNFKVFDGVSDDLKNIYLIGHVQAPTRGLVKDYQRIHPSNVADSSYMYHNGILKSKYIKEYIVKDGYARDVWDTELLNNNIYKYGFDHLSKVYGSFACLLLQDDNLYAFRNNNSIIYYDDQLSFSSVKFDNSFELISGEVFKLDLTNNSLIGRHQFKLLDNYYVEI